MVTEVLHSIDQRTEFPVIRCYGSSTAFTKRRFMKLVSFSVTNYRSITAAHRITLSSVTVLIGKNNEGKSNVLKALDTAMALLLRHSGPGARMISPFPSELPYVWQRDFPLRLQARTTATQTSMKLEFSLNDVELSEFAGEIGSNLNGFLPLEIKIGKQQEPQFRVVKSGKGTKALTQKSAKIAKFIASRIHFNYIPAVRTEKDTIDLISKLVAQELKRLEADPTYLSALNTIAELQRPILDQLAGQVQSALQTFLPNIASVRIDMPDALRRTAFRRDVTVTIDDGTATSLEHKGDGVKSLAALALLRSQNARPGASILAIEEPESHLHPAAIHQVAEIIRAIGVNSQVIITTHNPLFVDRQNIEANIIVTDGGANPAKTVAAIRNLLGIRASDNLTNANFALVVEGEEDAVALRALLPTMSSRIAKALRNNLLVLEPIGGAGNLSYKLSLLKTSLCATHTLLDNDSSGVLAYEKALADGLTNPAACTFVRCQGMQQSEFEDCVNIETYASEVKAEFGVNLIAQNMRGRSKWSNRIQTVFENQGKQWNPAVLMQVKALVGKAVAADPASALHEHKRGSVDALVTALDALLPA